MNSYRVAMTIKKPSIKFMKLKQGFADLQDTIRRSIELFNASSRDRSLRVSSIGKEVVYLELHSSKEVSDFNLYRMMGLLSRILIPRGFSEYCRDSSYFFSYKLLDVYEKDVNMVDSLSRAVEIIENSIVTAEDLSTVDNILKYLQELSQAEKSKRALKI